MSKNAGRLLLLCLLPPLSAASSEASMVDEYLDRYFATFPSAATAAGRQDQDRRLEDLPLETRRDWVRFNHEVVERIQSELARGAVPTGQRLDLELVLAEAERQVFEFETRDEPGRNPLFWTRILGNATVFLLVREDRPLELRLELAAGRAELIPRLSAQAEDALAGSDPALVSAELCQMAAFQARSTARFYSEGFARAGSGLNAALQARLEKAASLASVALDDLADFLAVLGEEATGSPRLAEDYARSFALTTGGSDTVAAVLAVAERDLAAKVKETAEFGRTIWAEVFPGEADPPATDDAVIRTLFARIAEDRAATTDEFIEDYRSLVEASVDFVRRREIISLPEPLTLHLDRSPSFFVGQSVGGVYPAGPYAPEDAKTLLFLPTPADDASAHERDAFFRDFNHHFNVMITPHELIPGHYLQLKYAARHPHKVRSLFGDGVYIEGWGTFCERLMLDLGWGTRLDRMAHLKKQLENIARTIVDIRVHTQDMTREEVLVFVQEKAFQDEQFAGNMWRRALSSSPQLTTYYLGYREVWSLYEDVRQARGIDFELKAFMNGMMELGPVPVRYYRQQMLNEAATPGG